jgi:hypothetical protein
MKYETGAMITEINGCIEYRGFQDKREPYLKLPMNFLAEQIFINLSL